MPLPSDPPMPKGPWPSLWWQWLMDLWLWLKSTQAVPDQADFAVSEKPNGRYFSLRPSAIQAAASVPRRLQIIGASAVGVPKVRVRLGYIADAIADPSMVDPGDSPPFALTLPGAAATLWIYATLPMSYSTGSGIWSASASTGISSGASVPANDATHFYVTIGVVNVVSDGAGGYIAQLIIPQPITGDVWIARVGNGTTYNDYSGQ